MKLMKQIVCTILTLCLCAGLLLVPSTPVSAATSPSAPKNVDVFYYENYPDVNDYAILVNLGSTGQTIKNIKTNSTNLKAKLTQLSISTYSSTRTGYVGVYAKKTGNYKVSFDVYNAKNKKVKSLSVNVRVIKPTASNSYPFKSITFDGKAYNYTTTLYTKNSVKVDVKMNSGYTLKSIEYKTYSKPKVTSSTSTSTNTTNEQLTTKVKKIKNNMTFSLKLGHYADYYAYDYAYSSTYSDYSYESHSLSTNVLAPTIVVITYQTKDKQTRTAMYTLYRIADDVK